MWFRASSVQQLQPLTTRPMWNFSPVEYSKLSMYVFLFKQSKLWRVWSRKKKRCRRIDRGIQTSLQHEIQYKHLHTFTRKQPFRSNWGQLKVLRVCTAAKVVVDPHNQQTLSSGQFLRRWRAHLCLRLKVICYSAIYENIEILIYSATCLYISMFTHLTFTPCCSTGPVI